jgi:hypothetical protein
LYNDLEKTDAILSEDKLIRFKLGDAVLKTEEGHYIFEFENGDIVANGDFQTDRTD